jgi:hypothetical protein
MAKPNDNSRSPVIIFDPNAKTGEFKRPDHPDFMTSGELKAKQFSGVRKNEMSLQYEFWIVGEIRGTVPFTVAHTDPMALANKHAEVFDMHRPDPKDFLKGMK